MGAKNLKISIIGAGAIGATVAYSLVLKNLARSIVLVNRNPNRSKAKVLDIGQSSVLSSGFTDLVVGNFSDMTGSDIVVITVGVLPRPNGTRLDVLKSNIEIFKEVVPKIIKYCPEALIIVVTNPVDIMSYVVLRLSGLPECRVIGSGTLLDTARMKYFLAKKLGTEYQNIETMVIGEHGETQVPLWSLTTVEGIPFLDYLQKYNINDFNMQELKNRVTGAGFEIRKLGEFSVFGISHSVTTIIETIKEGKEQVLPVSVYLSSEYLEIKDVFFSVPVLIGDEGIIGYANLTMSEEEHLWLQKSARAVSDYMQEAERLLNLK